MKHIMVDIETLSTAVNAAVLSIGAVEFDPMSGKIEREFYHLTCQSKKIAILM
mgnify:CR=1 FL=1